MVDFVATSRPYLAFEHASLSSEEYLRRCALEPPRGSKADKLRPAVLVSNDGANNRATHLGRGVLTVVPPLQRLPEFFLFKPSLQLQNQGWILIPKPKLSRFVRLTSPGSEHR